MEEARPSASSGGPEAALSPTFRRNFFLGVLNGIFFNVSSGLISSTLVLPGLVQALGGGDMLVGLLPALEQGGWLLPQLLVGARIQDRPRKLPLYRVTAVLRGAFFGAMAAAVALAHLVSPAAALALFILFYGLYSISAGLAGIPFQEVVAKTIPPQRRGTFFGLREFGGGLLTLLLVSPLLRMLLQEDSPCPFPQNYALLFGLALVGALLGLITFSLLVEPHSPRVGRSGTLVEQLRRLPALWREHPPLRRFLAYRVLARLGLVAEPFYIVYAGQALHVPAGFIGDYMAAITAVRLASYLVWSRLSDRRGNRLLLRWGAGLLTLTPVLALLLPFLGEVLALPLPARTYLFALVFALSGLGNAAQGIGIGSYVLELLPEPERPAGLGLVNTIAGLLSLLTILGGGLAAALGYEVLFLAATALALGSFLISWVLVEPRRPTSTLRNEPPARRGPGSAGARGLPDPSPSPGEFPPRGRPDTTRAHRPRDVDGPGVARPVPPHIPAKWRSVRPACAARPTRSGRRTRWSPAPA
ncbi:MAG: MFS transporter [Chloroflexia bacterium]